MCLRKVASTFRTDTVVEKGARVEQRISNDAWISFEKLRRGQTLLIASQPLIGIGLCIFGAQPAGDVACLRIERQRLLRFAQRGLRNAAGGSTD